MAVDSLDALSANPIAYAQAVNDEKTARSLDAAQAKLFKDQIKAEGEIAQTLISAATDDGRRLLAVA